MTTKARNGRNHSAIYSGHVIALPPPEKPRHGAHSAKPLAFPAGMNSKRIIKKIVAAARYEGHLAHLVEKRGQPGTYYRDRAAGLMAAARIIRKEEEPKLPRE